MVACIFSAANIAKLMSATTLHMIASLILFYYKLTFLTPLVPKILLQKFGFILITLSFVISHQTFRTVLNTTDHANDWLLVDDNKALTFLIRTEPLVRIFVDRVRN
jgi:hypothetical protein